MGRSLDRAKRASGSRFSKRASSTSSPSWSVRQARGSKVAPLAWSSAVPRSVTCEATVTRTYSPQRACSGVLRKPMGPHTTGAATCWL